MRPPPHRIGDYELLDRIAEGGMAEVWRARARGAAGFEKIVVVKRVLPTLISRPGFADFLVREAKIAARLSHPNIVQIFDLGETEGTFFIAMEYVHGTDLARTLTHRGASEHLSLALRVWIVAEVARALDHAHRRKGEDGRPLQIVHRDVSPQNVLLAHEGVVKVTDFGIARADEAGLGRGEDPKVLRGKYGYMSPEQARGESLDRRSDVFSLGVVLFEAITGHRLFRARTSQETLELVRAGILPDFASVGVPPELVPILARALAPTREERFAWASELHAELAAYLFRRGEPVGEPELARAMARMFPVEEERTPNKLTVDPMLRAYDDATSMSDAADSSDRTPAADARTQAMPVVGRVKLERRRVALLVASSVASQDGLLNESVEANGGKTLGTRHGHSLAVFGRLAGFERATLHGVRAALEWRHRCRTLGFPCSGVAVIAGECRLAGGELLEPDEETVQRAISTLSMCPDEVTVVGDVHAELEGIFEIEPAGTGVHRIVGYRRRRDRELSGQRAERPTVGRRAELQALRGWLERGLGGGLHVSGFPGVGKTRLLADLRASSDDLTWVVGRADEADRGRDFGILAEIVRDLAGIEGHDTPEERHARVERLRLLGLAPREVRALGELVGLAYPVAPRDTEGRSRGIELLTALTRALHSLARDRSLVLVLEDLHHADDASLQLLPLFVRGLARRGVSCITTRRSGAIVPILPGRTWRLDPLDAESSARLFASAFRARTANSEVARWVYDETGGNPAWIAALAQALSPTAVRVLDGEVTSVEPPAALGPEIREAVAAWLDPLGPTERAVLVFVALSLSPVETDVVLTACGQDTTRGSRAIHRLMARGWLVDPSGTVQTDVSDERTLGRWGGACPQLPAALATPCRMVDRALESLVDASDRAHAHQKLLAVLEARSPTGRAHAERLAHHAARAIDRRRAVEYHVRAADLAEAEGSASRAAELLLRALDIVRRDADALPVSSPLDLVARSVALSLQAGNPASARLALATFEAPQGGGRARLEDRVILASLAAEVALYEGRPDRAHRELIGLRDSIGAVETPEARAKARWLLVAAASRTAHATQVRLLVEDFLNEPGTAADPLHEGRGLAALAALLARTDELEDADACVAQALALAARVGHPEVRARALAAMGTLLEALQDAASAADRFEEAAVLARDCGLGGFEAELVTSVVILRLRAGHDIAAAKAADALLAMGRARSNVGWTHLASVALAVVSARTHPDRALLTTLERARSGLPDEMLVERIFLAELGAALLAALEDAEGAALARDDGASLAESIGWSSYARVLRTA